MGERNLVKKSALNMTEVTPGVVEPVAPTVDAQPEAEQVVVGEPVKTPATVDRKVYEQVRDDMKAEREAKRLANQKNAELEARIAELETRREPVDDEPVTEEDVRTKAKVDVLYLMQTDPFVKDNLDLIEDEMADDPRLTASQAVEKVQAKLFRKLSFEVTKSEPEVPPKNLNPKGNSTLKEAIDSDAADPRQVEAYKAQLARLGLK
jgi:glutamate racemase